MAFNTPTVIAANAPVRDKPRAATLRVPEQFATIQTAINAANSGDTVLVAPGTYREQLKLKPEILVRSEGDDAKGALGLKRAEAAILDGGGGKGPGVEVSTGATLDGFTVTGVGHYDDALWQREHTARGNGQRHEDIGQPGMAGIGAEEDAAPVIRGNRCHDNQLAGIGLEGGASAKLIGNVCTANKASGIGLRDRAHAEIAKNRITENALVAIGVTGRSEAIITDNDLARDGGAPPMIAVLDDSRAVVTGNTIRGGGVAGILVKGSAEIRGNHFHGDGPRANRTPNLAVWAQQGSKVIFIGNHVERCRHALSATGAASVVVKDNKVSSFTGVAIVIKDSGEPAEVTGNTGVSDDPGAKMVEVTGPAGKVSGNELKPAAAKP